MRTERTNKMIVDAWEILDWLRESYGDPEKDARNLKITPYTDDGSLIRLEIEWEESTGLPEEKED